MRCWGFALVIDLMTRLGFQCYGIGSAVDAYTNQRRIDSSALVSAGEVHQSRQKRYEHSIFALQIALQNCRFAFIGVWRDRTGECQRYFDFAQAATRHQVLLSPTASCWLGQLKRSGIPARSGDRMCCPTVSPMDDGFGQRRLRRRCWW